MVSTDGVRELSEKEGKMNIIPLFFYSFTLNIKQAAIMYYIFVLIEIIQYYRI